MQSAAEPGLLGGALATVAGIAAVVFAAATLPTPGRQARDARPVTASPEVTAAAKAMVPEVLRRLAPRRPLVVYIGAEPCRSCLGGARSLAALARRQRQAAFVAVAAGDTRADADVFFRRAGWPGPRLVDTQGVLAASLAVRTLPSTLLLDRRRRVVLRIEGAGVTAALVRAALGA